MFVFNENNFDFEMNSDKSHIDKSNKSEELKNEIKENKSEVEIFAMGDMIFHQPIVKNYKTENSFDFTPIFQNISEDINEADIAIANFEGSVNSNRALSGFPLFNFPKEYIFS